MFVYYRKNLHTKLHFCRTVEEKQQATGLQTSGKMYILTYELKHKW